MSLCIQRRWLAPLCLYKYVMAAWSRVCWAVVHAHQMCVIDICGVLPHLHIHTYEHVVPLRSRCSCVQQQLRFFSTARLNSSLTPSQSDTGKPNPHTSIWHLAPCFPCVWALLEACKVVIVFTYDLHWPLQRMAYWLLGWEDGVFLAKHQVWLWKSEFKVMVGKTFEVKNIHSKVTIVLFLDCGRQWFGGGEQVIH